MVTIRDGIPYHTATVAELVSSVLASFTMEQSRGKEILSTDDYCNAIMQLRESNGQSIPLPVATIWNVDPLRRVPWPGQPDSTAARSLPHWTQSGRLADVLGSWWRRSAASAPPSLAEWLKAGTPDVNGLAALAATGWPGGSYRKLETAEAELVDVKRRMGRLYDLAETTDLDIDDFKLRIRDDRERQERLEATAEEARAILSQRRELLDDVETITAYALDLRVFLHESELTERRAFIESFVKEIVVMPDDSPTPGRDAEEMALNGSVLSTVKSGGPFWTRTRDLSLIRTAL